MSYQRISFELVEKVAHIGFGYNCKKSMTILDEQTLKELDQIADELTTKSKELIGAIFFSHKERCFLAGADIGLIASMQTEAQGAKGAELGQEIYNKIEDLKIPTVACINGVCLGGGTEFALSCNTILLSNDSSTVMGLPEVKLGVIPGFGGTYRLPKKIGLPASLDLILSGKTVKAKKCKRIGLADEVFAKERMIAKAPEFFKGNKRKNSLKESLSNLAADNFLSKKIIFQKARESVLKKTKGFYQAPLKILDTMEAGMMKGRTSYLQIEAQAFGELCISEQSKNLQHIYFMTEEIKKFPGKVTASKDLPKLKRGAILGAGTMGGGIAWLMASNDMAPIMKDLNYEALELGLKQSSLNFMKLVKRKRMTLDEFERKQRSICPQTDFKGFKRADLLIEAIVENMDIKKSVLKEVEKEMSDSAILTSNTSSLSIVEMAKALERPERFAGLHFFNPVNMMPLVEIITHPKVSEETIEALYKWVLKAKKTPVIVNDGPGFLVNRILGPFMNEAGYLLEEGVSMKAIDDACLNFGMPMGPCRLLDEVGLDVGEKVGKILEEGLGKRMQASGVAAALVAKGFLGRKTNKGFYLYNSDDDKKGKVAGANEEVEDLFPSTKKQMDETEIQMRIFLPMINEAALVLDEKIVQTAANVDLGLIFGIGFPPFRGGLLRYADSEGIERIYEALNRFASEVSQDRYGACDYLKELVEKKQKFYDKK